ncbi:MAG: TatD family hydrolase [Deltaproteobacteria bacterium]|nr:TatD family hydrolase [Deltaproteobacteria bacterium]
MSCIDSHAHLDLARGSGPEVEQILARAWDVGLEAIVAIAGASQAGEFSDTLAIAKGEPRIRVAAGIHPHLSSGATPDALDKLRFTLDEPEVVALGETGLDYHYNHSPPADQRRAFVRQLRMAHEARVPVVIHTREADDDTQAILRDEGAEELGGVIHCFSSGADFGSAALELGMHLSFSGIVTFPKADEIRAVAKDAPADRLLAETDSPFLSPVPFRGKVNEPARVVHVVEKLAEIRGVDVDQMGRTTADNTRRLFGF